MYVCMYMPIYIYAYMYICLCVCVLTPPLSPATSTGQFQANPPVAGPMFSQGKPTRRTVTAMGSNELVVTKTTSVDRVANDITCKRAGEARQPLAAYLGEKELLLKKTAVLRKYPIVEMTSEDSL